MWLLKLRMCWARTGAALPPSLLTFTDGDKVAHVVQASLFTDLKLSLKAGVKREPPRDRVAVTSRDHRASPRGSLGPSDPVHRLDAEPQGPASDGSRGLTVRGDSARGSRSCRPSWEPEGYGAQGQPGLSDPATQKQECETE